MRKIQALEAQLKTFGENVQKVRKAKGITQEELAEKANLSARSIQRIEAGTMNILLTTALRIWTVLGCQWEKLYPGGGHKE